MYCVGLAALAAGIGVALGVRGPLPAATSLLALALLHVFAENQITDLTRRARLERRRDALHRGDGRVPRRPVGARRAARRRPRAASTCRTSCTGSGASCSSTARCSRSRARQLGRGVLGHRRHRATRRPARLLLAALPTALVYSIVNVVLVCGVVALSTGQRFRDVIRVGSREYLVYYPFALLGVFLGPAVPRLPAGPGPAVPGPDPRGPPGVLLVPRAQALARGDGAHPRRRARGEGPVHRRSRRAGRRVRAVHRPRARHPAGPARAAAARGAHARRRQARRAEPPAQQAGQAHRRGVRDRAQARGRLGGDPHHASSSSRRSRRAPRARPRSSRRSPTTTVSRSSRTSSRSPTRTTR